MQHRLERIDRFVEDTRQAVFVRPADQVLFIRPDKTFAVNATAMSILSALYARQRPPTSELLDELARELGAPADRLLTDTEKLVETVGALLRGDFSERSTLRFATYERRVVEYPTLSEIALTYDCQNRCQFCYAASPYREGEHRLMTTAEVERVMDRIFHEAHVPSLSFTGGEATLRRDLPELIHYGHDLGFRVNLITNGVRAAKRSYAERLAGAGLDSAQISLEAATAELHDHIVGRRGAFERTVAGVQNLRQLGLHVHTNTTLCAQNLDHGEEIVRFVGRELGLKTMSMNMVIRTGAALGTSTMEVSYRAVGERLPQMLEVARAEGVLLVWYSPIPYCIFNPVLHDLGAKSCACVDGILSVDPAGQVLPCSSFGEGIGSLLDTPFERIYQSRAARYWRDKRFVPPACKGCADLDICGGGCPLYWDAAGSFAEIPRPGAADGKGRRRWERARKRGRSFGVPEPQLHVDRATCGQEEG
ncbi:MAG: radical SAM protein [Deltaproteobacteria bacterium]|jgi:radical SAM protein with 4Fe4S-binding SPASM domain|nr:radical SAM protein [Deltaproteobacteria bacterium]MBW2535484.1 radical SAM protein [Deltaproteobacteria bacterium]